MFTLFPSLPVVNGFALIYLFVKAMFLIGFALYVIFAFIAARQIDNMQSTVITPLSPLIRVLGYLHLLLAIGAFLFTFMFLV
ncbi:hypothetical protein BH10PAT2_BH10PAT2_0400 [soil metagenome]